MSQSSVIRWGNVARQIGRTLTDIARRPKKNRYLRTRVRSKLFFFISTDTQVNFERFLLQYANSFEYICGFIRSRQFIRGQLRRKSIIDVNIIKIL